MWQAKIELEVNVDGNKNVVELFSGETKRIGNFTIDVAVRRNTKASFGPYFLKTNPIRMYEVSSERGYPLRGIPGVLQCSYNKTCIMSKDICECDNTAHTCTCDTSLVTEGGVPLPFKEGGYTIEGQQGHGYRADIILTDESADDATLTISTSDNEIGLFEEDKCEIKAISSSGCYGCTLGADIKVEYISSDNGTVTVNCNDIPVKSDSSPAIVNIHSHSSTLEVSCTLKCGYFEDTKTKTGHFEYAAPVNHRSWKTHGTALKEVGKSDNIYSTILSIILKNWDKIIIGIIALVSILIFSACIASLVRLVRNVC